MHSLSRLQKIQTPRLLVRPIQLGDEHMIHPLIIHSSALLKQWMPWAQTISFDSTYAFVKHAVAAWQSGSAIDHPMVMIRQADQAVADKDRGREPGCGRHVRGARERS